MKTLIQKLFFIGIGLTLFVSCKKDQTIESFSGGTQPALTATVSGTIPLSYANAGMNALSFNWTNPGYQFASGVSSQDVSYLMEIDTLGANFTNPNRQTLTFSKDLSVTFTQSAFNAFLLNQLVLTAGSPHTIQVRVTSSINSLAATNLVSNVLQFIVTPYAIPPKVNPPATAKLYLVGSATSGGWNNPVPVPAQQFTQVSATLYTLTVSLTGGQEYLFLPLNGDWGHKFACNKTTNPTTETGGDFGYDWNDNFPGPAVSGTYKIDVDFQRGKYTVTKQ